MLLVRVLDRERGSQEVLRFMIAEDGEIGVLSGDAALVDFQRGLPGPSGEVSRQQPREWLQALAVALRPRFEVRVAEATAAGTAGVELELGMDAHQDHAAERRSARLRGLVYALAGLLERLGGGRRPRLGRAARVLAPMLLVLVAGGVVLWRSGVLSAAPAPGTPRPALSGEAPPPVAAVPSGGGGGAPGASGAADPQQGSATGAAQTAWLRQAATNAAVELAGSGDGSIVAWNAQTGLWGDGNPAAWWQSAIDLYTLVRYLEATGTTAPAYQQLIATTYRINIRLPGTNMPRDFANEYMDDTGWWGVAWLEAAEYELLYRHDLADARRYLAVAEWDARYIYSQPRPCHTQGIEWQVAYPPDTITNAEFVTLAARLALFLRQPGPLHDAAAAAKWLKDASRILGWMEGSGLVNLAGGSVKDRYNGRCQPVGGALTYTEGEVAEALVRMGEATNNPSYYNQAAAFLNHIMNRSSHMLAGGVLQDPCEAQRGLCSAGGWQAIDQTIYKGVVVDAVADWALATNSSTYDAFLQLQAKAVVDNAASDGRTPSSCQTPHTCQIGFYWSRKVPPAQAPIPVNAGTQAAGLAALVDALMVAHLGAS